MTDPSKMARIARLLLCVLSMVGTPAGALYDGNLQRQELWVLGADRVRVMEDAVGRCPAFYVGLAWAIMVHVSSLGI